MCISTLVPKGVLYTVGMSVELCVWPPPNLHHVHHAKSQSPCTCTLALEAPFCLVGALTMCPPPPINLWQYSTLHLHLCTHAEPSCTATFGCAHSSMFSIAWRTFSPQTSPSGTIYPMVGVPSMCPPHLFSHFPTSGHPCGPAFLPTWPLHGLHTTLHTLPCTSAHLHAPLPTFVPPSLHLHTPLHTSLHLHAPPYTSMHPSPP